MIRSGIKVNVNLKFVKTYQENLRKAKKGSKIIHFSWMCMRDQYTVHACILMTSISTCIVYNNVSIC